METIKNYLDNMFMKLPATPEVHKAKEELFQMMEDRYEDLIAEGKSENEAVGVIISEFGNLEELAEALGISSEVQAKKEDTRDILSLEDAKGFIEESGKRGLRIALGVMLCILSVSAAASSNFLRMFMMIGQNYANMLSLIFMLIIIAVAIVIFVKGTRSDEKYENIRKGNCILDVETTDYIREERKRYEHTKTVMLSAGIILCIVSLVPAIVADGAMDFGAMLMFLFIAAGVFLIINTSIKSGAYETLLKLNENGTMEGEFIPGKEKVNNTWTGKVISVYWYTVLCVFLIIGFLTFKWGIALLVWPWGLVGFIVLVIIDSVLKSSSKEEKTK